MTNDTGLSDEERRAKMLVDYRKFALENGIEDASYPAPFVEDHPQTCPKGYEWKGDAKTGKCVLKQVDPNPTSVFDIFGVQKLFPTSTELPQEWYLADDGHNLLLGGNVHQIRKNADGTFSVDNNQKVRLGAPTPEGYKPNLIKTYDQHLLEKQGYMQSPKDWRNVEITMYVFLENEGGDASENFCLYARSGRHTDANKGCEGTCYKFRIHYDGRVGFAKEQWHNQGYSFTDKVKVMQPLKGRWIGAKMVLFNEKLSDIINGVRMIGYIDEKGDGKSFKKVAENTDPLTVGDRHEAWGTEGGHCSGSPEQIISWGGPVASFRWDGTGSIKAKFKHMSVREIAMPAKPYQVNIG